MLPVVPVHLMEHTDDAVEPNHIAGECQTHLSFGEMSGSPSGESVHVLVAEPRMTLEDINELKQLQKELDKNCSTILRYLCI